VLLPRYLPLCTDLSLGLPLRVTAGLWGPLLRSPGLAALHGDRPQPPARALALSRGSLLPFRGCPKP